VGFDIATDMEIYEIDPSYQITAYHCDPVPKPGDEYIDEKGSVYIVRGQVVEAPRPLVLGLDDWDQGYTFRLYPRSEHNVDGPKGKLRRILPKEEIQEARSALIKKLRGQLPGGLAPRLVPGSPLASRTLGWLTSAPLANL
jgi:hypothetical protein